MKGKSKEELIEMLENLERANISLKGQIEDLEYDNDEYSSLMADYESTETDRELISSKAFNAGFEYALMGDSDQLKSWLNFKVGAKL